MAGLIMPKVNAGGARSAVVQGAVREIERIGGPQEYLACVARSAPMAAKPSNKGDDGSARLGKLPVPTRLALEMALHEEQERRALLGELRALEIAWRAADEIAGIADDLLLSDEVRSFLARARREG